MRATFLVLGSGIALISFALAPLVACGSSSGSGDTGSPPVENPPGQNPPAQTPDPPPKPAVGDPCRGAPLPTDQHFVPSGMCASLVASGLGQIRQVTFAPDGTIFAVTTSGVIYRMQDADGDGYFQAAEIKQWATFGNNGNNCHIDVANGYLYAGVNTGVRRWAWSPTADTGGTGEDVVTGQPSGGHTNHTVHVYDGFLYVHSGSSSNAALDSKAAPAGDYDDNRSLIRRFDLSQFKSGTPFAWLTGEIVTQGLRNANGFTRNAKGKMYAVVNGLDNVHHATVDVHNDNPGEQVLEIAPGKKYGYPYCFTAQRVVEGGNVIAPGTQLWNEDFGQHDDAWCATNSSPPTTFIQAHSAPLDIIFFDNQPTGALPEKYRGGAFIALHGSWDRGPATGYKVIWMPFNADGTAPMPTSTQTDTTFPYETIFGGGASTGVKDGPWSWQSADGQNSDQPRPASVAIHPIDGALYVTSDQAGTMYRIGVKK
jgi:glucose/arabinose dehydrogenase